MVLIVTLVVLVVVAVLGASSLRMTGLMERMASNSDDSSAAYLAADAAIMVAEQVMEGEVSLAPYEANANGKYLAQGPGVQPRWQVDATWLNTASIEVAHSGVAAPPRYIIESVKTVFTAEDRLNMDNVGGGTGVDRTQIFRVTALAQGKTSSAVALVQSTYGKKL